MRILRVTRGEFFLLRTTRRVGGQFERVNEPIWQALIEEPIRHGSVERNLGCDAHIDPKVPQREQHLAVCGAFAAIGDRSARFRATCDVEQRAANQRRVCRKFEVRANEDAREI